MSHKKKKKVKKAKSKNGTHKMPSGHMMKNSEMDQIMKRMKAKGY